MQLQQEGSLTTDGTRVQNIGAGSANYLLQSNGAAAPTWINPTSIIPTTIDVNSTSADLNYFPVFVSSATTGYKNLDVNVNLSYNPNKPRLTVGSSFVTFSTVDPIISGFNTSPAASTYISLKNGASDNAATTDIYLTNDDGSAILDMGVTSSTYSSGES